MEAWSDLNRLAETGSPYLEQHIDNPVHWIPWGNSVFEEARRKDLPVLVSIGYSSCHWCHVMAHESFEDPVVADVMNASLVNVKVDREQYPGVDAAYMEAAQAMTGSGGWPLNVFVDHDGRPFLAVTYQPPSQWISLVREIHRLWMEDRSRIITSAESVAEHLTERRFSGDVQPETWPDLFLDAVSAAFDIDHPGFAAGTQEMKFPPSQTLDWFLEQGGPDGRNTAEQILTAMMDSGLHDRVGGGFHRYSVDRFWRVPHFEKMAYDNAQLMGLYARASILSGDEALSRGFMATAESTADWFLREMRIVSPSGGFIGYATASDADDPLGEGTYFAWPPSALEEVLGDTDAAWLADRWNIDGPGALPREDDSSHFEPVSSWIPHPRGAADYPEAYRSADRDARDFDREQKMILRLRAARSERAAPGLDDKVLTDQNALILEGFTRLARYGTRDRYLEAAVELADLLVERMNRDNPTVIRSEGLDAYITDYGYLVMALTGIYSLTGSTVYVEAAEKAANEAMERLATGDGDYYSIPGDDTPLFKRPVEEFDGPAPAGQYALGVGFHRLYTITGNSEWRDMAVNLINARGVIAAAAPMAVPTLVRLGSLTARPYTLVIAGSEDHPITEDLASVARSLTGPDTMIVLADQAGSAVDWVELEGRRELETPQLLICREGACLLPAFTADEAVDRLRLAGLIPD